MKKIAIIGASGHGKVVADIARLVGYEEIIFLDDNVELYSCGSYYVRGSTDDAICFFEKGYDLFVAIGNAVIRQRIQSTIESVAKVTTLIHPNAVISEEVSIGDGTVVIAGAVVNPGTRIGRGCIINTGATVDHDNDIKDFVHVSVGAHLAGTVSIGERTWIGAGAIVSNNITICQNCIVGAGAVVVKSISYPGKYVGVPAKLMGAV